jgi:hypothetical protein
LHLLTWIDFLLHQRNYQGVTEKSHPEPLSVPSIIRREQFENSQAFVGKVQKDSTFVENWIKVMQEGMNRGRKQHAELVELEFANVALDSDKTCREKVKSRKSAFAE